MIRYGDIGKREADAYREMKTALEWAEHEGARLLTRIREHGIDHPRVDEQCIEYRRKLNELDAASRHWRSIFEMKKQAERGTTQ